ncbi:hypothetical protein DL768_007012 [Monosporascus sp. mg162]|nr:hypothetical protein DL768_007012 [Monosporascus sp. mg162]
MARFFAALLAVAAIMLQGAAAMPFPYPNGTNPDLPTSIYPVHPGPTASNAHFTTRALREVPINLPRPAWMGSTIIRAILDQYQAERRRHDYITYFRLIVAKLLNEDLLLDHEASPSLLGPWSLTLSLNGVEDPP